MRETYGHAHEGLVALVNITGGHCEGCKKEIDATKKKRGEGWSDQGRRGMGGKKKKKRARRGGRGRKIPVRGWKRMVATSAQSGRPGAPTV
jgi:hypothetical protein